MGCAASTQGRVAPAAQPPHMAPHMAPPPDAPHVAPPPDAAKVVGSPEPPRRALGAEAVSVVYASGADGGAPPALSLARDRGARSSQEDDAFALALHGHAHVQCIVGVCDGHSGDHKKGRLAAGLVARNAAWMLMRALEAELQSSAIAVDWSRALESTFDALAGMLADGKGRREFEYAGTTATLAVVSCKGAHRAVHVANVGDSACVLVARDGQVRTLTEDHTVANEIECARAIAQGGFLTDDARYGKRINGLQVTRSLGDFGSEGTSDAPAVASLALDGSEALLVCASDGLWNVLAPTRVAELVLSAARPVSARFIIDEALRAAQAAKVACDNISVVIADLRLPSASASAGASSQLLS